MLEEPKTKCEENLVKLATAIKQNDTESSLDLIKKIPAEHLFYPDENGRTHLQNAINLGRNDIASTLTRKDGVTAGQLLSRDNNGKTALDDAIRLGKGSLITEILTNKSIGCKIPFKTFEILYPKELTDIIPIKTIEAAEKVVLDEMAKFSKSCTKIDGPKPEEKGFKVVIGIKPHQARETDGLERTYIKSDALMRRVQQAPRETVGLLTYNQERQR